MASLPSPSLSPPPPPPAVWIKLISRERQIGNRTGEEILLRDALKHYPHCEELWLLYGTLMAEKDIIKTRQIYLCGLNYLGNISAELWLAYARIEEKLFDYNRVRTILEHTQFVFPKYPSVWLESIRFEIRCRSSQFVIDMLFTRALTACPRSGIILAEQIELASTIKERNQLTMNALRRTNRRCPIVMLAAARTTWMDIPLEINVVMRRLTRTVTLDPNFGDGWAALYCFTRNQNVCPVKPTTGEKWIAIRDKRGNEDLTIDEILKRVIMISNPNDYKTNEMKL